MKKIGTMTSDGDALVRVAVYDTDGNAHDVHAVLDTGFDGAEQRRGTAR